MPRSHKVVRRATDKTRTTRQREYSKRLKAIRSHMSQMFLAANDLETSLQEWDEYSHQEGPRKVKPLGRRDAKDLHGEMMEVEEIIKNLSWDYL